MKVLVVHAHENPKSYNSALKDKALEVLTKLGHEVKVSNLYAMDFNPVASKHDFVSLSGDKYYKIQNEQKSAAERKAYAPDLQAEMDKLLWCDLLIFNFPLWWFSVPAILKGWIDRVFAFGFSYSGGYGVYDNGRFKEKKGLCCITTGGPEQMYSKDAVHKTDKESLMHHIQHNTIFFNGIEPLDPFFVFGAARLSDEERKQRLTEYGEYLKSIVS